MTRNGDLARTGRRECIQFSVKNVDERDNLDQMATFTNCDIVP